jgi:hypothetical protein
MRAGILSMNADGDVDTNNDGDANSGSCASVSTAESFSYASQLLQCTKAELIAKILSNGFSSRLHL